MSRRRKLRRNKKTRRKRKRKRKGTKKKRRRRKRGGLNWFFTRNSDDNNLNIVIANKPKRKSMYGEPHWLRKFLVVSRDNDDFDEIDRIPDGFSISNPFLMFKGGGEFEDDVRAALSRTVINGKKCLDIGTRDGLNCLTLVEKGAKSVLGIDVDNTKFLKHQDVVEEEKITLIKQNLFEMDENEKFDVITCFLWNFGFPQLDEFALKVKSLLKNDGVFILGLYDEIYVYGDENTDSVPKRLEKYFKSSKVYGPRKRQQIWEMRV
jgi:2-polyprenyl-3-methyl-5-hydroxy-6-metoxy-1,4-benzoquinol methylase